MDHNFGPSWGVQVRPRVFADYQVDLNFEVGRTEAIDWSMSAIQPNSIA